MNIVYIIGNGFDLNLGLKTRYSDFYNYYKSIESNNGNIMKLKNDIQNNYPTWSDLELAIGYYTGNFNSSDDFETVFDDVLDKLGDYLSETESSFDLTNIDRQKFYQYISYPEKSLLKADELKVKSFKDINGKNHWRIDIITLNYTRIIEKIIDYKAHNIEIGNHTANQFKIYLRRLEHLHGYTDSRMIMGVNDISQIENSTFHENDDILNALVKSNCNKASKHTIDDLCKSQIQSASIICIFGSSIGDTDNIWWELIGEQLKNNCILIIFERGEFINPRFEYKKEKRVKLLKNTFLNKTKLTDEEKNKVRENIFIGVNTNMFNLIK